jgi:hypothetical protein
LLNRPLLLRLALSHFGNALVRLYRLLSM